MIFKNLDPQDALISPFKTFKDFTFTNVDFDSTSVLVLTSNLNIVFQSSDGSAFEGVEFELLSGGVQYYATPFYGGTDSVSDSDGEVSETFTPYFSSSHLTPPPTPSSKS